MLVIDLKAILNIGRFILESLEEMAYEYWTNNLFTANGFSAVI